VKWMPKQKRARGRTKKNWMEGIRKASEKIVNSGVYVSDNIKKRYDTDIYIYIYI
jgi:hypothetical protein